jgi:hypothetical protein
MYWGPVNIYQVSHRVYIQSLCISKYTFSMYTAHYHHHRVLVCLFGSGFIVQLVLLLYVVYSSRKPKVLGLNPGDHYHLVRALQSNFQLYGAVRQLFYFNCLNIWISKDIVWAYGFNTYGE